MGLLLLQGSAAFNPRTLFASGEQGLWLDPSDFSTMWQDSAKTTPVTAAGDPVGYISDKSGRGNDASQSTSASRPTLARIPSSGRRNLLTRTEEFDNAAWGKTNGTSVTPNTDTAPSGELKADSLFSGLGGPGSASINQGVTVVSGTTYTVSFFIKAGTATSASVGVLQGSFLSFSASVASGTATISGTTLLALTNLNSGWTKIVGTFTAASSGTATLYFYPETTGVGTQKSVIVTETQLETGSTASNYQKVAATTDVTESGVGDLWHLVFDGSDDSLVTNSVDFSATDEMTVIAGVRKLSDAARGTVCELTATSASNNGAFHLTAPNAASATYAFESKGTLLTDGVASSVTAPLTSVISGSADISADTNVIRVNGSQSDSDTGDQGTGNYSNAIIYIGRRGGTTLPYNGHLYQLIIRGKTTPTGKLLEAERFVGRKTGVSF